MQVASRERGSLPKPRTIGFRKQHDTISICLAFGGAFKSQEGNWFHFFAFYRENQFKFHCYASIHSFLIFTSHHYQFPMYWFGSRAEATILALREPKFSNSFYELSFIFSDKSAPTACKTVNKLEVPTTLPLILRNHERWWWSLEVPEKSQAL